MSFLETLAVGAFAFFFIVATVPAYLAALVGPAIVGLLSEEKQVVCSPWVSHIVILLTSLGWRFAISMCCWLRIKVEGFDAMRLSMGASGRPCVVLANHTSLLDTIMIISFLPLARVGKVKLLIANDIFEKPCIGRMATVMGHIAATLQSSDDKVEIVRDGSEEGNETSEGSQRTQRPLDEYVTNGGWACWFTEDSPNSDDSSKVGQFSASGMALAVRIDVEVWCFAFVGNSVCWPQAETIGGLPARLGLSVLRLCESSHQFLEEAESLPENADEIAKASHLADAARGEIQSGLDGLVKSFSGKRKNGGGCGAPVAGAFGGSEKES